MTEKEEHFFIRGQLDAVKKMINFLDDYTKTNVDFKSTAMYDQGKVHALFDFSKALSILNNNLQVDQLANDHDMLLKKEEEKTWDITSENNVQQNI